jgi:hypothetical protein
MLESSSDRGDELEENPCETAKRFFELLKQGGLTDDEAYGYGRFIESAINSQQVSWADLGEGMNQDQFDLIYVKSVPGKPEYYRGYAADHELDC